MLPKIWLKRYPPVLHYHKVITLCYIITYGYQMWNIYELQYKGICKNQIWLPNMEYLRGPRHERTTMTYKYKIFEIVN